jgi:hypothetical protein
MAKFSKENYKQQKEQEGKKKVYSKGYSLKLDRCISKSRTNKEGEQYREDVQFRFIDPANNDRIYDIYKTKSSKDFTVAINSLINKEKPELGREEKAGWDAKHLNALFGLAIEAGADESNIDDIVPCEIEDFGRKSEIDMYSVVKELGNTHIGAALRKFTRFPRKLINGTNGQDLPRLGENNAWSQEQMNEPTNVWVQDTTAVDKNGNPKRQVRWILKFFYDIKTGKTYDEILDDKPAKNLDTFEAKCLIDGDLVEEVVVGQDLSDQIIKDVTANLERRNWNKTKEEVKSIVDEWIDSVDHALLPGMDDESTSENDDDWYN